MALWTQAVGICEPGKERKIDQILCGTGGSSIVQREARVVYHHAESENVSRKT